MKKKLREDITQTAQKIIELNDEFDTQKVKDAVKRLYEKLVVLSFLESQLEEDSSLENERALDSKSFREENWFKDPKPVPQPEHKEDLIEPLMEKIKDIVAQMPEESEKVDAMLKEVLPPKKYVKNDLEEFAATYQQTPTFERKDSSKATHKLEERQAAKSGPIPTKTTKLVSDPSPENKPRSINESITTGLNIGLNDRLAFIKHLFNGNADGYNRTLTRIESMKSFDEASSYIKGNVKPEYNYWLNKDEYRDRFMNIIERSFN